MPNAKKEKSLYKIVFYILDSLSNFKISIVLNTGVNDITFTYAQE